MTALISSFKNPRILFAFVYDFCVVALAFWGAIFLRFDSFDIPLTNDLDFNRFFFAAMILHAVCFITSGLYQGVWRFSSMHDLLRVVKASAVATLLSVMTCFLMTRLQGVPRSLFLIHLLLLITGLGGGRFIYRFLKDYTFTWSQNTVSSDQIKNVLIVGAGRAGEKLLRDIHTTPSLGLNVVGFVDDNQLQRNALIHNKKVLGTVEDIPELVSTFAVDKIFIAIPSASGERVKRIVFYCKETSADIKILPKVDHLLSNQVELSLLRNLNIEDLLGRQQVQLDTKGLSEMIQNKRVMVTGAGGSIGSELSIQIAKFKPSVIVLVDSCELFMYELEMKFKEVFPGVAIVPKILDVRNEMKVRETFEEYRPNIVFHAAAYKHVPMMEHNPSEAIETNVKGTKIVGGLALEFNVEKFIFISTDKAVNPTNVMGASKRIAEMVLTDFSAKSTSTQFMSVRFGNVLGSNGSVIPLFRKQIESGKDLTVTDPEIVRYFMSIPEACQLVLQAGSLGAGGEIFVLDMGEPVKIVDLAREMIRLAGLKEGRDINIVFTGLRPGEKLYEELFSDCEACGPTMHSKINRAFFRPIDARLEEKVAQILRLGPSQSEALIYLIKDIVPEFEHSKLISRSQENSLSQQH